jgi:hypothetical protein
MALILIICIVIAVLSYNPKIDIVNKKWILWYTNSEGGRSFIILKNK